MQDSEFLLVAKQAATEAGKIVKKYYNSKLELQGKGHFTNFATKADWESEAKVIEIIKSSFSGHNIIAEESGKMDQGSEYTWAIDPIDGTIPFVDGLPFFGVSIGLLKNNNPYLGVINMVAKDELFWAEEGKGAFKNGQEIRVSGEQNISNVTFALEFGHNEREMRLEKHFKPVVEKMRYVYVFGSAVQAMTLVAQGSIEGSFMRANVWDFVAGAILIQEAGGKVTDLQGGKIDYTLKKIHLLATNGLVHENVMDLYK